MKTTDFSKKITSKDLKENLSKQFNMQVTLEKYNREQLEDMRNKLRTRIFQHEGSSKFNDLLKNESYQKDKAMLELLNTRIKEMLGEDIKKLRDRMVELSEGKKGVKIAKHPRGSKGSAKGDGNLANNYPPYDKVTRGDVIAGATGKDQKGGKKADESVEEGWDDMVKAAKERSGPQPSGGAGKKQGTRYGGGKQSSNPEQDEPESKAKKVKESKCAECGMWESKCSCATTESKEKPSSGMSKKEKSAVVKKAKAGGDIGKPGKTFKDVSAKAAKKYGSKERGDAAAAAAMWKSQAKKESQEIFRRHVKIVNESLAYLIQEDEEGKAKAITAAGDMVNDFTSWMQRVGQYQTKSMIELADAIRADFGAQEAETFKQSVGPALSATLEVLTQQREAISNAVAVLAGEATPETPMGAEPGMEMPPEPGMEPAAPDMMNEPTGDEFAASDAAAGGAEVAGRAMRESREQRRARKLAESHSIIAKLAK